MAFKCDHEDDCGDNSDEEHCGELVNECVYKGRWNNFELGLRNMIT